MPKKYSSMNVRTASIPSSDVSTSSRSSRKSAISKSNSSDGTNSVDIELLKSKIRSITHYANEDTSSLTNNVKRKIDDIIKMIGIIDNDDDYSDVVEFIREEFKDIDHKSSPNSVYTLFYGCLSSSTRGPNGITHCSDKCAGNIQEFSANSAKFIACPKSVITLINGKLEIKYIAKDSKSAYIHAYGDKFYGLSPEHVAHLRKLGIDDVTITTIDENSGISRTVQDNVDLKTYRCPQSSSSETTTPNTCTSDDTTPDTVTVSSVSSSSCNTKKPRKKNKDEGYSTLIYIVVFIVFLIFVVLFIYLAYGYMYSTGEVKHVESAKPICTNELSMPNHYTHTTVYYGPGCS